jgi:hypothetical protein
VTLQTANHKQCNTNAHTAVDRTLLTGVHATDVGINWLTLVVDGIANDDVASFGGVDDAKSFDVASAAEVSGACVVVTAVHARISHVHVVVGFVEQSCCQESIQRKEQPL